MLSCANGRNTRGGSLAPVPQLLPAWLLPLAVHAGGDLLDGLVPNAATDAELLKVKDKLFRVYERVSQQNVEFAA